MSAYEVVTFGEAMIRLTPPHFQRLEQCSQLSVTVGGSELNAAVGLARLGLRSGWVSKLVRNPLGRMIADKAREHGVDVSNVVWVDEGRVGLYFVEEGASPRASSVLYDRRNAAIASMTPEEVAWGELLRGVRVFHTSGITPALSESCAATTAAALRTAKAAGCTTSFDLNFRARLWSKDAARECLAALLGDVDILFSTSDDLETVFGLSGSAEEVARRAREQFALSTVVITIREAPTVLRGRWSSLALAGERLYRSEPIELELVDRVGSGDAYVAGFLYGHLTGDLEKAVRYGDAMSILKHSIPGDFAWFTLEEVEGQVKRRQTKIQR